ncbi:BfmA/BtgA family mobilization protein [Salinimicrobium catena]|nr:BfmA/BtgA family mobilization protein [Salinimicrobium catena]
MEKKCFVTLKIKSETAEMFRKFSRDLGEQQTETLQLMLDFFSKHNLNPSEDLGPNMKTLEGTISKRINVIIAIIRDIEKRQTKPTLAMLQLLFQESPQKQPLLVEKRKPSVEIEKTAYSETQHKNEILQKKVFQWQTITTSILDKVAISRTSFGKIQLRLLMSPKELQDIKTKIEKL